MRVVATEPPNHDERKLVHVETEGLFVVECEGIASVRWILVRSNTVYSIDDARWVLHARKTRPQQHHKLSTLGRGLSHDSIRVIDLLNRIELDWP